MTLVNDNTQIVINHPQKGTHLTIQERGQIQVYKEMGLSNRQIAKKLNRAPKTINNEVKRGWVKTIKQIQKKANGKNTAITINNITQKLDKFVMRLINRNVEENLFIGLFLKL
ncbi:helix-turn-helix domain-containing protein [Ligilactobacillus equi]